MTKGYIAGLLDFKYTRPLSRRRENYIVNFLEKQDLQEVMQTRAVTELLLAGINPKQDIIDTALSSIKEYVQMALPSTIQKGKIEDIRQVKKDELKSIKDRLAQKRVVRQKKEV